MQDPRTALAERFAAAAEKAFGPDFADADPLIAAANNPKFGDFQSNMAMPLAKRIGKPPRQVAEAIIEGLDVEGLCQQPEIAGPGFINLRLEDAYLASVADALTADPRLGVTETPAPQTVVVDYSSPNVAKQMHVGHLRSTVIGDALARVLTFVGHRVIRQNHLGDWGTQFGMLIENLLDERAASGASDIADLEAFYQAAKARFDAEPEFADRARARVVALQGGDDETVQLWEYLVAESKRHFNQVYGRLGVSLVDADVRPESFYNSMLGGIVADLDKAGLLTESDGAACVFVDGFEGKDGEPIPLIVRKSDGGFLYATTDLAGIRYRVDTLAADRIIYVTDARQRQHFAMVFAVAQSAGWLPDRVSADHVAFGTVLGPDNKPFKTRSGGVVRLADLLDEAESRAAAVDAVKGAELSGEERKAVDRAVGVGAVKYADLASDRIKDYVFDWDRMLALEGNTAPYLQMACVRTGAIARKADAADLEGHPIRPIDPAERALVLKVLRLGEAINAVAEHLEPHRLCGALFELAAAFGTFFNACPVLRAESDEQRRSRLGLCRLTGHALRMGLDLLGIEAPERM